MILKNYQEDIVLNAVHIALEDYEDLAVDEFLINDIAAYVLNRLPPLYIMSDRGFLRLASLQMINGSSQKSVDYAIRLMLLVNRGIEIVRSRRKRFTCEYPDQDTPESDGGYIHYFPQIIGKVTTRSTTGEVNGTSVLLKVDDLQAEPEEPGWMNPYSVNEKTDGLFCFWPRHLSSRSVSRKYRLTIEVTRNENEPIAVSKSVRLDNRLNQPGVINPETIINLGTILI